ncbi:cingulin-like [Lineus longissimus]|uniref:cingulin-like n=1 Tax=Lineus longissimus TaxID=88925 RepID=UPI00315D82D2
MAESSSVSTCSEEPDEDLRRVHNRLSLRLEKDITADQLKELKQYFYRAPLDPKIYGKIASFIELWNTLDSYRTIKPGKYTHLKKALSTIGAKTCLATVEKFEIKEFKSRDRAISRESAKQLELEALIEESADLRKQVERERRLKDEAENLRDTAIREREVSHIRHESVIHEAGREVKKKKHRDDHHQAVKVANYQGAWRVVGPEQVMEALDDVDVTRFDLSQQNQEMKRELEAQCKMRSQAEKLKDLALTERELSHIEHEKAIKDARLATKLEHEQRTRAEMELEDLRKRGQEEKPENPTNLRTTDGRIYSHGTLICQENHQGFGVVFGNYGEGEAQSYRAGHQVEVKSRSRSESDTDKGRTWGNRATERQRFVASSWDETMSDQRPAVQNSSAVRMNTGVDQLNQQREGKGLDDWIETHGCESDENVNACTNNTSNGVRDLDLDDILDSVLRCIDTNDLQRMTEIMDGLDADARKVLTSLKVSHQTAVFKACVKGHVEFVEYFLSECGAATEEIGQYISEGGMFYQATPLWWASFTNQQEMVQTLITHGADVNAELTAINSTPVLSACAMGNAEVVKYLSAHGANLQKPNANGETCLHKSVQSLDLCLFLLNHGADINQVDGFGRTPLHQAVDAGPVEVVRLLARRGADVNLQDCCGDTGLDIAFRNGREKVTEMLLNRTSGTCRGARR